MVTTVKLKEKSITIMNQANAIGISKLYIAENHGSDQYSEDEYISPSSIIFETVTEDFRVTPDNFNSFRQFLISELSDVGISLLSKSATEYNIVNENILSERSKHLLDTAIDITMVKTDLSWKVQFEEQRNKKKDSQVDLQTEPREIETCLQENKRQKLDHPSAEISLPNALQVDTSAEVSAEEAKQMKEQNIKLTGAIQRLLEDKKVIIPQNVRRQLQEEFPQIFTSQQSVK